MKCLEDFPHLAVHPDSVVAGDVFNQLLSDGRTAGFAFINGDKQVDSRPDGALPVHAVVVGEPLVLQGDKSVDQILGNVVVIHPDAVFHIVQPVEFIVFAGAFIHGIEDGGIA